MDDKLDFPILSADSSDKKSANSSHFPDLMLYGMALAAIPQTAHPECIDIICTPISVNNSHREEVQILEDLRFKTTCNSANPAELMSIVVRITDTLDAVVKRQHQSLNAFGLPYRPVALEWGQDSRKPIHFDAQRWVQTVFGCPIKPVESPEHLAKRVTLSGCAPSKALLKRGYWGKRLALEASNKNLKEVLDVGAADHIAYFSEHPEIPEDFKTACIAFPNLMNQCTLKWGNFNPGTFPGTNEPTEYDVKIRHLLEQWRSGDEGAFQILREEAYLRGGQEGVLMTQNSNAFGNHGGANKNNPDFIHRYAGYHFYQLDPVFEKEFLRGFNENFVSNYTRKIKFPLDQDHPPFVDPCAGMILDQFQIIDGQRSSENIRDEIEWRTRMSDIMRSPALKATLHHCPESNSKLSSSVSLLSR